MRLCKTMDSHSLTKRSSASCGKIKNMTNMLYMINCSCLQWRMHISIEISRTYSFFLMHGTILMFIKFNNLSTWRLNGPRHWFQRYPANIWAPTYVCIYEPSLKGTVCWYWSHAITHDFKACEIRPCLFNLM